MCKNRNINNLTNNTHNISLIKEIERLLKRNSIQQAKLVAMLFDAEIIKNQK